MFSFLEDFVSIARKEGFEDSIDIGDEEDDDSGTDSDEDFHELVIYDIEEYGDVDEQEGNSDHDECIDDESGEERCLEEESFEGESDIGDGQVDAVFDCVEYSLIFADDAVFGIGPEHCCEYHGRSP